MKRRQIFLLNALVMTAASLFLNCVGVWFNLYVSDKLGAVGMGVFSLMMSVYSMATTLAASGINLAATRMVAEETVTAHGDVRGAMRRCLLYSLFFGAIAAAALWFGAEQIGIGCLHSPETVRPLRWMAFTMPFIGVCCALNGYFTAVRHVVKAVCAQFVEQFLKVFLTIVAFQFFTPPGLEAACVSIMAAGVVAEGGSCLFEYLLYRLDLRQHQSQHTPHLTSKLLGIALPVAFSTYLRSGLSTIKHLLVPVRLQAGGMPAPASFAMFGAVHGVALPVINFPYAFLNAFNCLIVPELAQSHSQKQDVGEMIDRMFALTIGCAMGVCGVLFAFPREIGALVSENPDVPIYIRLLAPVIPVMYLDTAVDNMLKGLDEQVSVMRYNVIDAASSLAAVWLLLPMLGIKGYILIIVISEVLNFSLSLGRLVSVTSFRLDITERLIRPLLCAALAVFLVKIFARSRLFALPFGSPRTLVMMALSAILYFSLLTFSSCEKKKPKLA